MRALNRKFFSAIYTDTNTETHTHTTTYICSIFVFNAGNIVLICTKLSWLTIVQPTLKFNTCSQKKKKKKQTERQTGKECLMRREQIKEYSSSAGCMDRRKEQNNYK